MNEGGTLEVVAGEPFRVVRVNRPGGYVTTIMPTQQLSHQGTHPVPTDDVRLVGGRTCVEEEFIILDPGEHELVFRIARPWDPAGGADVVTRIGCLAAAVTARDCLLDGDRIRIDRIPELSSAEIARIIGPNEAGLEGASADEFIWHSERIPLDRLVACNQDGAEPAGGWKAAYERHRVSDERAVRDGSPAYAGRQDWLEGWARQTEIYPIYLLEDAGRYFMVDGHHRLAGAHFHDAPFVWAFVGRAREQAR
ncbi:hypothetical protein [Paracoccus sp. ME4]|uniref:hypothetical protein n=1 Tax=Paracoccus sp. ME4 TaxID=3138066 RepID=UPI00398B1C0C